MPLFKKTQRSFSGGQLDKDLMGRQDLAKYSQGCLILENFKVRKQGNAIKRSGTDLVCDFTAIRSGGAAIGAAKLVPVVQERESGLYILLTGGRAYLVSPDGVKMNNGTWSRSPAHAASPSTLAPYSIAVPFSDAELQGLDWCQSGDTIFTAHRMHPPGKFVYAGGELEYSQITFRQGLGIAPRISSVALQGNGWTGTGGVVHVEYAVTAVKDGVETGMSVPVATEYNAPWPSDGSILITIDTSSLPDGSWDHFNVYKKEADVFGLIGTTSNQTTFVDVSSGFSVGGTLYPDGYTEFDKSVHLRESGNKFASVWSQTCEIHYNQTSDIENIFPSYSRIYTNANDWNNIRLNFLINCSPLPGYEDNGEIIDILFVDPSRSKTAQKIHTPVNAADGLSFSFTATPISSFKVSLGSLEHQMVVEKQVETIVTNNVHDIAGYYVGVAVNQTKYCGRSSVFSACSAKYFTATVEYLDNGTWTTSSQFDCSAVVDQTNPGAGWTAVTGASNKWQKDYDPADAMWSYTDASSVLARMDANAPTVGASAEFSLPSALAGKTIRKITLYGWTSSGRTATASVIANGIACYQEGAYVNTYADDYITPDLTVTPPKTEDHFVNPGDYPGCVQLYSQRLVYAATANEPFTFWMSCTGDLYNFDVHEYIRASDAIKASTAALEMPRINRMLVHRDLMLFAEGGEWQVAPSTGNAVAPSTISAKLQSTIGCAQWLKPIPIDADIVFCDSSGETLMATRYNFASDGYDSSNLSVLSQRLFRNNPIRAMAFVQFPEGTIECVLSNGTLASLVYMKEHDVCAWSHHTFGGGWRAKDVAANKSVTAGSSHCAFIATRTAQSGAKWAILALRDIDPNDDTLAGNLRMDAVRTATTSRAAGATGPTQPTVDDNETAVRVGEVRSTSGGTTSVTGDVWAIGSTFKSTIKTTSPEFTDKETAQMEVKNATESEIRVIDGSDFTVRQADVPSQKATRMKVPSPVGTAQAEFTVAPGDADCRMPLVGTNMRNGSIVLEHDGHLPLSVLSVTTSYRVEFANHADGGNGDGRE